MSGESDKGGWPSGAILGEDTPSGWDDDEAPAEGLTEFEFHPPTSKGKKDTGGTRLKTERRTSSSADLLRTSNVEALLDKVINEVAPRSKEGDAIITAEMDEQPRPSELPTTRPARALSEPHRTPPLPPLPVLPTTKPAPPLDVPDAAATAEMRKPALGARPTPTRPPPTAPPAPPPVDGLEIPAHAMERTPVPVGRDVGTEMFDGQAAAIDRMVQVSLDGQPESSVRIPEALSEEVRAVSKVLMGKTPGFDTRSLADDLALEAPAHSSTPIPKGPIPPPMPTSSPSGAELDAVADAFTMETSDPAAESILELAYDPKAKRSASRPPPRRDTGFLDEVTPSGMTSGTKIMIAIGVVLLVIGAAFIFR